MSSIRNALENLNAMVEQLETNVAEQEVRVQEQQELFEKQAANGNNDSGIDPELLARKLDVTIEQVEQLLKEG